MKTVVIAGASGFIGAHFSRAFAAEGWQVRTVGRTSDAVWGDTAAISALLEGADLLVNLAGKSVSCRYTPANKAEIVRSRTETTAELGRAIAACSAPPSDWFNASTGTIYRDARDRPQDECDGELGSGFPSRWRVPGRKRSLPRTLRQRAGFRCGFPLPWAHGAA